MLKELFNRIMEVSRPEKITVAGDEYITTDYRMTSPTRVETLNINTLSGFVDYINEIAPEENIYNNSFVVIKSYRKVAFFSFLGDQKHRENFIETTCDIIGYPFGIFNEQESAIIGINSGFERKGDYEYLLKVISHLAKRDELDLKDNGLNQETVMKTGFGGMLEKKEIKNPLELYPFRTFREIPQAKVSTLLRINNLGHIGLFEIGDAWKLEAIANIKKYLKENINGDLKIIA